MNILGYTYKLKLRNADTFAASGQLWGPVQEIHIADNLTNETTISSTLHEILEAISFHLNLELDHSKIMPLEVGLFQVLTTNGVDLSPLIAELRAGTP